MITVTKTYLPSKNKYQKYVDGIYKGGWITNNGPLLKELEIRLQEYLDVKNLILVSNGTIALDIAYRLLGLKKEVITTPFSFVATTSSIVMSGLTPIFADIDENSLNMNPIHLDRAINSNTSAIVPVHVFGNACDVEKIEKIADENNLKVIYDAAHAFGVKYKDRSLLSYGDISTLSFHATKLFHTIEGGAIIIKDDSNVKKARHLINFGIENEESIPSLGTNAKMNEFQAAMGLCMLDEMNNILDKRCEIYERYVQSLSGLVELQKQNKHSTKNYSYFPVIFENEAQALKIKSKLNDKGIFPRRYFYPSLDTLDYINPKQTMKSSRDVSRKILCLPLYCELTQLEQNQIIGIIKENL